MYQRPNGYESGLEQLFKQGSQSSLDLFNTLASANPNQQNNKKQYSFGDIIYVDKTPCFKINRHGVITIFVYLYDKNKHHYLRKLLVDFA